MEPKNVCAGGNAELNKKLIIPVSFDEVTAIGPIVAYVEKKVRKDLEKEGGKKIRRFDSNFFHFLIYPILEETEDKKLQSIARGYYKHGPYIPAVDSYLVLSGAMEEHQHQMHIDSKERMGVFIEYR